MKKAIRLIIVGVILAALILGYYYYLSNRRNSGDDKKKLTEYDKIVSYDLKKNYPETPRGVVKRYNRIISEYYSEKHSDRQIEKLSDKTRLLFDSELLDKNPIDSYHESVKADVRDWNKRKATIITTDECSSNDVRYATVNGDNVAYVTAYYYVKNGKNYEKTFEEFCLRKSENRWKILTWRKINGDEFDFN